MNATRVVFSLACLLLCGCVCFAQRPRATVVVDDTALWGRLPLKDQVADASSLKVPWLFNNTALLLLSQASMETAVQIPEAGTYHLFARSRGGRRASFRVALGNQISPSIAGGDAFSWQRVGKFELPQGSVQLRLTRIFTAPALDVLVLTKKENFTEEELRPLQLHEDVKLLKEYKLPTPLAVNFGDANDDGKLDLVVMSEGFSAHVIDHDGRELWRYEAPKEGADVRNVDDINGLIYDLDADGRAEVLHWRYIEGGEWLVVADGRTGDVKRKTKWPANPLNCNPVFVKGDWRGDGKEELFWRLFRMKTDGEGVLYFSEPVYHMFDFVGDRAEEVVTLQGDLLRVYGYSRANHHGERIKRDPDYWRTRLANHDH